MKVDKFNQSRFYLRRDPDAGRTLAARRRSEPPICADTGAPKHPGNCWNVRCQLGGTCCRTAGVPASEDDFKTAVLRCRYPVCKTIHPSGWGWDTSRLNEVIADHAGVPACDHALPLWAGDTPNGPQFWCKKCGAFQPAHGQWQTPAAGVEGRKP